MKASEIIRNLLDLIDQIDSDQELSLPSSEIEYEDEPRRFKQIFDLLSSQPNQSYDNSPAITITGIDSVTSDAGGGWNGPKHPSDIRSDSVSMYPFLQHKPGNSP